MQADIALLPFFKRFQIALLEFQAYDLGQEYDGALLMWMVSRTAGIAGVLLAAATHLVILNRNSNQTCFMRFELAQHPALCDNLPTPA